MKALVLTCDRYRPVTEHMLKTYEQLWPANPFTFLIPYQSDSQVTRHGQRVIMVNAAREIMPTVHTLLAQLKDDEWLYWCIDDKFPLSIDADSASYFARYVQNLNDPRVTGLSFCRARHLLVPPHVSNEAIATTDRGDPLVRRYNYNNIWIPQFLRARVLRALFARFPNYDFRAIQMDSFTRQGPKALGVPEDQLMYVTSRNFVAFGESTVGGKLTRGCIESMQRLGLNPPENFQIEDISITIGSYGDWVGE